MVKPDAIPTAGRAVLVLCLLGAIPSAYSATISVPTEAFTIQAGIDLAQVGDTVLVAPGIYSGPGNKNLDFFGKDLCLIGPGGPEQTIIDCQYEGRGMTFTNGETRAAIVQGLTIRNGYLPEDRGGGINCYSDPTFRQMVIAQNTAKYSGGVSISYEGSPLFEDVIIESNTGLFSSTSGGITICTRSYAVLQDVVIRNNNGRRGGGANICTDSHPTFTNVLFEGNQATGNGGAIWCASSMPTFAECQFINNQAGGMAGAVCAGASILMMNACLFEGNTAGELGGGLVLEQDHGSSIQHTIFHDNIAGAGGGIYIGEFSSYPPSQFKNVTVSRNRSLWGAGGVVCVDWQGKITLEDCIIAGNLQGGGIFSDNGAAVDLICSDVFGNAGGNYIGDMVDQSGIDGNISVDPLFCDTAGDGFTLFDTSLCLPENNSCGVLMGTYGQGCTLTAVQEAAPAGLVLDQNHPNPFNPWTEIRFHLPVPGPVDLGIYDITGRCVSSLLANEPLGAGPQMRIWEGADEQGRPLASGIYFVRLHAQGIELARKMTLLR